MNFCTLVSSMKSVGKIPSECRRCPDQYIGNLRELETAGAITTSRALAEERPVTGALVIVLESPHKNEYEHEPAPAKGITGLLLVKHLREVVRHIPLDNPPVILMNAVQYQCSLGCVPTKYRDEIFMEAWNHGAREDFIRRLNGLYQPDDYVVCCCTKGNNVKRFGELRQKVFAAVIEAVPSSRVLRRTHPSRWYDEKNRNYEWESA